MKEYTKPELHYSELEPASFLCVSIQKMDYVIEVDEYVNIHDDNQHILNLDSD